MIASILVDYTASGLIESHRDNKLICRLALIFSMVFLSLIHILLARTEGLFTDPCYTGKIFHGFVDLVRSGKIPEGENAIFLHSGGTPAIWSKEHLDAAQEIFYGGDGLFVHKA